VLVLREGYFSKLERAIIEVRCLRAAAHAPRRARPAAFASHRDSL